VAFLLWSFGLQGLHLNYGNPTNTNPEQLATPSKRIIEKVFMLKLWPCPLEEILLG